MAMLISDKKYFKTKFVKETKKDIIIKLSIHQNINFCKYICTKHQSLKKYEANTNSIEDKNRVSSTIVGDFNTLISIMDRLSRQTIRKSRASTS